jgi:outer membrane receptor protein involved in Fe transport
MRHFLLVLVLLLSLVAAGADVRGRVTAADSGLPVAGANVIAAGTAVMTDLNGHFHLPVDVDSITVTHVGYQRLHVAAAAAADIRLLAAVSRLPEVIVRAGLTDESLHGLALSVSVVDAKALQDLRHLQDMTATIPNLNWAGGTSRPQYFQIRGIGERSNYAGEGPPSFSVGTVIDDVDLSGLGTGGQLFDLDQIEVYRGPQSTIYGANAMAGLIAIRSADPVDHLDHGLTTGIGSDGLLDFAGFVNVPVGSTLALRAGYARGSSDGFRHNELLRRQDTNRRRESVARLKGLWTAPSGARVTATWFHVDADNGYDAWAPDNNKKLVSYADNPGVDAQRTTGLSLRAEVALADELRLVSISAFSHTAGDYSFDSDWGNDDFWRQAPYDFDPDVEGWRYDFFDHMERQRDTWTQEARFVHTRLPAIGGRGIVGLFVRSLQEDAEAAGYLFGGDASELDSAFDVDEVALYAQHHRELTERLQLRLTARADRNQTVYVGATDGAAEALHFDTSQWLAGGRMALSFVVDERSAAFISLARGYRSGGINQHPRLAADNRPYEPEYVVNTEAGYRWLGQRGRASITAFHGRRSEQQVELSTQQVEGDPNSFVYFTNNAGTGWNAGVEIDADVALNSAVGLTGSLGYLQTQVDSYTFSTAQGQALTLGDRESAHAPTYNLRLGVRITTANGPQASLEFTAMDEFFFSDSHDQRSDKYSLWNGSLGYAGPGWSVRLWGRNLLDTRYAVRGFYFGLEPPAYEDKLYVSYGDPRQVGVTLTARLLELVPGI